MTNWKLYEELKRLLNRGAITPQEYERRIKLILRGLEK